MPQWVINSNGDAPETFRDSYATVARLARELQAALQEVHAGPLHGRNYQTLPHPADARSMDVNAQLEQIKAVVGLKNWALDGQARYLEQRGD